MKKLAFLGGMAGLGIAVLLAARVYAADHADGPALATNPMADINDLYTWMDGTRLNLAMTVSPLDVPSRAFSPAVQYVFHVHSKDGLGAGRPGVGVETRVICRFASDTSVQCWIVDGATGAVKDYVTGDPSNVAGITSSSAKVRIFAGRRSDPFFFNLEGFRAAQTAIKAIGGLAFDVAGCPVGLTDPQVAGVRNLLAMTFAGTAPCPVTPATDCFKDLNVRVLLVQVEKSLVNAGSNIAVGVWASTHQGS